MAVKTSSRGVSGFLGYSQGVVLEVAGNLAVVKLTTGLHVRVRTDMLPGKSDPPIEGERWILDQAYGDWRFAIPVAFQKDPIRRFALTVGDGVSTAFSVPHGLGTKDVLVQVYNPITNATWSVTVVRTDADHVSLTFASAPATNAARVVVIG